MEIAFLRWPGTFIQLRRPGRAEAAQSLMPGAQVWILTPLKVFGRASCLISLNHNSFICKMRVRESGCNAYYRACCDCCFYDLWGNGPCGHITDDEAEPQVRDIPVVTELPYWWECSVGAMPPNWVHCPLFIQEKPPWGMSVGTQPGLPWAATTSPRQPWTSQCLF